MNKSIWPPIIIMIISGMCFFLSYIFLVNDASVPAPKVVISAPPPIRALTWYTSIPQIHAERLANAFRVETGIDVKISRSSTFIIRDKLMAEIENGTTEADVLTIADVGTYVELKARGHLLNYVSLHDSHYPAKYKDRGYWIAFAGFGICMAYDESRVKDPPKNWRDILNVRWRGRVGLEDINTAGSQYGQYYILREELGTPFWEKLLSAQHPRIFYKTEELAKALLKGEIDIAGEFSIHTVYDYMQKKKTTIKGIYPEEGIPVILNPIAIMKQTNQPETAITFLDFLLSEEGQYLMQRLSFKYSLRMGMIPLDGIPSLDSLHVLTPKNASSYAAKRVEYIQEFNNFFQK